MGAQNQDSAPICGTLVPTDRYMDSNYWANLEMEMEDFYVQDYHTIENESNMDPKHGIFPSQQNVLFPVFRIRVFFRIQLFFLSPDLIRKNPDPIRKNPDRIRVHEKNVLKSLKLYVQVENLFISYLALSTLSFLVRLLQNLVKNIIYNSLVCSWTDWIRVLKFGYETLLFSASIILSQTIALCNLMCL